MDAAADLLARAVLTFADSRRPRVELRLDDWPLVCVDLAAHAVGVNDLRAANLFSRRMPLPPARPCRAVRVGAVGDELYLLVGDAAAVFVVPDPARDTHAEVRVVDAATGRLLCDLAVRYRQVDAASPNHQAGGG